MRPIDGETLLADLRSCWKQGLISSVDDIEEIIQEYIDDTPEGWPGWTAVERRLPEIGKPVLAYFSSGNMDTSRRERTGWSYESIY